MKHAVETCVAFLVFVGVLVFVGKPWQRAVLLKEPATFTERVECVTYRTQLRHAGCVSNGVWNCSGRPVKIEAYGIDKHMWPHRCSGCGATNMIYDARWPQIKNEWRVVE